MCIGGPNGVSRRAGTGGEPCSCLAHLSTHPCLPALPHPAGRDGLPSECLLYFSTRDVPRILQLLHYGARRSGKAAFQREVELLNQVGAEGGVAG